MNWREIVEKSIEICSEYYRAMGSPMTLRKLFYTLVGMNIIPNTRSAYKLLSKYTSEERYVGDFPSYLIADDTRESHRLERHEYFARECSEDELKRMFEQMIENMASYSINPWLDQRNRVIVVVEKRATFHDLKVLISQVFPFGVHSLRYIRGYDSATGVIDVAETITELWRQRHTPVILLFGDFDPSGEDIVRDFIHRVERISKLKVNSDFLWEKVAVTKEQIEKYKLPHRPEDEEEIRKLQRDPRFKGWIYGLYRVELEALFTLSMIEENRRIVKEAIEKYFDWKVFEEKTKPRMMMAEEESRRARLNMIEKLKKMIK